MTKQPTVLRMADALTADDFGPLTNEAAAELRRLHEVNQELLHALQNLYTATYHLGACPGTVSAAHAVITKVTGVRK